MICRNPKFQKTFEIAVISMKFFIWTKNQSHKMRPLKKLPIKRWMIWRKFMRMPLSHWKVFTNIAIWVTVTLAIRKSFRSHWLYLWDHGAVANLLSSIIWLAMNLRTFHLKLVCKINPSIVQSIHISNSFMIFWWFFQERNHHCHTSTSSPTVKLKKCWTERNYLLTGHFRVFKSLDKV